MPAWVQPKPQVQRAPKIKIDVIQTPSSDITEIVLNGKPASKEEMCAKLAATLEGGYLFNANVVGKIMDIGFLKSYINQVRYHHGDFTHPPQSSITVLGFIGSTPNVEMAFEMPFGLSSHEWIIFVDRFIRTARFFIENGFPKNAQLGLGPRDLLEQMKALKLYDYSRLPETLEELAALPLTGR